MRKLRAFIRRIDSQSEDWRKHLEPAWRSVLLITILAVHRPSFRRLERYLCLSAAVGAFHGVHLPWPRAAESAIVPAWAVVNRTTSFFFSLSLLRSSRYTCYHTDLYIKAMARHAHICASLDVDDGLESYPRYDPWTQKM